jgi:putative sigma-54 modulation protein
MTLDVTIFSRNMTVSEQLSEYATKKVSKLDRFLNGIDEARVDLSYAKAARNASDRQVAQITVRGKGFILRSEERADDIFAALDIAVDKLQRQIERFKGKRRRGRGDGRSLAEAALEVIPEEEVEEDARIIARRKKFLLLPMDEAEAIEQMEMLGHENFFVYFDVNSNSVNVLYKRRDNRYGLIQTEIG